MGPFSDTDRKKLESNPVIEKITKSQVSFTSKFKAAALKKYDSGIAPKRIFVDADLDLSLFPDEFAKKTLQRWRRIRDKHGMSGLKNERRGSGSTGRPKKSNHSHEIEIALLKAEISILKKLQALAEEREK